MVEYFRLARSWFDSLEPPRRWALVGAILAVVTGLAAVGGWSVQTDWETLMSGRSWEDVLDAAASLDKAGVTYRIDGHDTLQVAATDIGRARAAMTSITARPSLGDVSDLRLGLGPQAQQWAFLRALEGDLARSIDGIDGIQGSQVHIVPREEALFIGEDRAARASVFVTREPGVVLGDSQVRAIVELVANAVDGLSPDRVAVADDRGQLLATGTPSDSMNGLGGNYNLVSLRTAVERRYEDAVSEALMPVLGIGTSFSVAATVDLDPTADTVVRNEMDVGSQAVLSEVDEQLESKKNGQGGAPGVASNVPGVPAPTGATTSASDTTSRTTTNYEYPRVQKTTQRASGAVTRLSVAVQVDETRLKAIVGEGGDIDGLKKQIDAIVRAAVGAQVERKDVVTVSYVPFAVPEAIVTESSLVVSSAIPILVRGLIGLVALMLLFFLVVRPLVSAAVKPLDPVPLVVDQDDEQGEDSMELSERLRASIANYERVNAADLNALVEQEARAAAQVLRLWSKNRS